MSARIQVVAAIRDLADAIEAGDVPEVFVPHVSRLLAPIWRMISADRRNRRTDQGSRRPTQRRTSLAPAGGDSRPAPASTPAATLRALDAQGWDEV